MQQHHRIHVSVRFRPLIGKVEEESGAAPWEWNPQDRLIGIKDDVAGSKLLKFDAVFGPDSKNQQIFDEVALPIIKHVIDGYNGTIFCYGQTGSGKTYTIQGVENAESQGLLPNAIQEIFKQVKLEKSRRISIKVSYFEIYNEKIVDLLQLQETGEHIRIVGDDQVMGVILQNLVEVPVSRLETALDIIRIGEASRHYRSTDVNQMSSRSHAIFRLVVNRSSPSNSEPDCVSCLNIVDLAGSERYNRTKTSAAGLEEAGHTNRSLLALREVIAALSQKPVKGFVPYRNSKLTRVLRQSLGGNALTSIICMVSPAKDSETESINTLNFGAMCAGIQNIATKNEIVDYKTIAAQYEQELLKVQAELKDALAHINVLQTGSEEYSKRHGDIYMETPAKSGFDTGNLTPTSSEYQSGANQILSTRQREAVDIWQRKMEKWYEESLVYNDETTERSLQVDSAAERLESRAKSLAELEAEMIRQKNDLEKRIRKQSLEEANKLVHDFEKRYQRLMERENAVNSLQSSFLTNSGDESIRSVVSSTSANRSPVPSYQRRTNASITTASQTQAYDNDTSSLDVSFHNRTGETKIHCAQYPPTLPQIQPHTQKAYLDDALMKMLQESRRACRHLQARLNDIRSGRDTTLNEDDFKILQLNILEPLQWLDQVAEAQHGIRQEQKPFEESTLFPELERILKQILVVSIPIVAAQPGEMESETIKAQRRLLNQYLSQAKITLLRAKN